MIVMIAVPIAILTLMAMAYGAMTIAMWRPYKTPRNRD